MSKKDFTIDPNEQIIALYEPYMRYNKSAFNRTELSHYCKNIETVISILKEQKIKARCLKELDDISEQNSVNKKFSRWMFVACFSHEKESNKEMWDKFANNGEGFRIKFTFDDFINDCIDYSKPVIAYNRSDEIIRKFDYAFHRSGNFKEEIINDEVGNHVFVEIILTDVKYKGEKLKNESIASIDDRNASVLNKAGKQIKGKYHYQNETRLLLLLRTTKYVSLEKISYLMLPISIDKMKSIEVLPGEKCSEDDRKKINELCNQDWTKGKVKVVQ